MAGAPERHENPGSNRSAETPANRTASKQVSVVVPVRNGEKVVGRCLQALQRLDFPAAGYEIIVVDNGSRDGTVEAVRQFEGVRVLSCPQAKVGGVRNHGAESAAGKFLAFIDADCIASPAWLTAGVSALERSEGGIVGAHYRVPEDSGWVGKTWAAMSQYRGFKGPVTYIPGGNLFIRKDLFHAAGGFDGTLTSSEDVDLCHRVRRMGLEVYSDPAIEVSHLGDDLTVGQFFRKEMWRGADVVRLYLQDRRRSNRRAALFALYHLAFLAALIVALGGAILCKWPVFLPTTALAVFLTPSFVMALQTSVKKHQIELFFRMWAVYLVFGIARGLSALPFGLTRR